MGYLSHDNDDAQTNNEPKSASSNGKDNLINFFNETRKKHIIIIVSIFVEYVFMQVCKDIMQKYVDVDWDWNYQSKTYFVYWHIQN